MTEPAASVKSFYLDQHGCAKNQVDGELIISLLENKGWVRTERPESARVIIINSCGFIESAKKESLDALFSARKAYPDAKIILAGCLAERYADVFKRDLPEADAVFGNGDLSKLDFLMDVLEKGLRPVVKPEQKGVCCGERKAFLGFPSSAYVKITEGCNNRCSFCAIPLIRGVLRSRSADDITDEIRRLLDRGIFEFNLIGQDLAAFGRDGVSAGDSANASYFQSPSPLSLLLQKISKIEGDFWLRLLYIHPDHFPLDILPVIQRDKRILPYFDLPFQSGDARIIRAMNRRGSPDSYLELLQKIRAALPDAVLRTTFLCGFPGETDEEAEHTLSFLEKLQPHWSGCFAYSREDDTPAALLAHRVPAKTVKERIRKLQNAQEKITVSLLASYVGKVCSVLIEEVVGEGPGGRSETKAGSENKAGSERENADGHEAEERESDGLALGRCAFQAPEVDGICVVRFDKESEAANGLVPGSVISVRITGVRGVDVTGVLV